MQNFPTKFLRNNKNKKNQSKKKMVFSCVLCLEEMEGIPYELNCPNKHPESVCKECCDEFVINSTKLPLNCPICRGILERKGVGMMFCRPQNPLQLIGYSDLMAQHVKIQEGLIDKVRRGNQMKDVLLGDITLLKDRIKELETIIAQKDVTIDSITRYAKHLNLVNTALLGFDDEEKLELAMLEVPQDHCKNCVYVAHILAKRDARINQLEDTISDMNDEYERLRRRNQRSTRLIVTIRNRATGF